MTRMRTPIFTAAVAAGIGLLLFALAACSPPEERADQARESVREALQRGDRPAALEAIDALGASTPDTAESLMEIAALRVQAGDAPRAAWILEEGLRRFPDRDDLRLALARVALLLGNPSLTMDAVRPIDTDSAQHSQALVLRAQAELSLGHLDRALATLAEAEGRYPDESTVKLIRIQTLISEHRHEEARAAIEEARAAFAGEEEDQRAIRKSLDITLLQLRAQQGESDAAVAALTAMVKEDPADALAWQALIQLLAQRKEPDRALALLEDALRSETAPLDLYNIAAQLHIAAGDTAEAESMLRRYAERNESAAATLPLFRFHADRNELDAATAVLEEAIARFPEEASLYLIAAETKLARGEIGEARDAMQRFEESTFEGDPQIDYLRARIELAEGDAAAAAKRLTYLAPKLDRASTQYWLGRALEESGDTDGALRRYELAMTRDPNWTPPTIALIQLGQKRGAWRSVATYARDLVQHAPHSIEAWIAYGDALENLGETEAALQVAEQCRDLFPDRYEAQLLLAKALRAQRRYGEALAALDAMETDGTNDAIAIAIAAERIQTLGMGNRAEEAAAIAAEAIAEHPEAAELYAAQAAVLFAIGAVEQADASTDRALALAPDQPHPLRTRCNFRASAGHWPGARDDCRRYIAARPDDPRAHLLLGVIYQQLGDTQAAIAAYRRVAALDGQDARARNNLAWLLAETGDVDGALAAAQEAYRLDEQNPYIMDTVGALYLRKGLAERAVSLLEEAHAAAPDMPDAALHLGMAYSEVGRTDEARAVLTSLRERSMDSPPLLARIDEVLHSLP